MRQAQNFFYNIPVDFQQLNSREDLTRHRKGCHVMQVGPMWQANGNQYATKWQVSHCSVSIHSTAVVHPACAGFCTAHIADEQCLR